jgi:glucose/arabinose dehydrogenase
VRRSNTLLLLAVLTATLTLSAAADEIAFDRVATVARPVAITHAGDTRLFITQQNGRIAVFDGTSVLAQPFLDITPLVSCCGERGLLSAAFHPRYRENGFFYVDYTDASGATVIARYSVSSDPNRADPNSAVILLTIPQPFSNHNGGQLQFGPDGYLYIGMGDGGSAGDPGDRAQNLGELLGKLLRIDVDHGSPYAIPPSNPFVSRAGARGEIWAYGLRNPWRFSFDRVTGDLWIADVGQGAWEEIDFQTATSPGGENYGWRRMEGNHCFNPASNCDSGSLVKPIAEYSHAGGACSVTGGYVYRGTRAPRLSGAYLYGDYCSGTIWGTVRAFDGTASTRVLASTTFDLTTFGEDLTGELYAADYATGAIYRIRDAQPPTPRRRTAPH